MPRYRATFVRVSDKKGTRLHPAFFTNATDEETLKKEAAGASQDTLPARRMETRKDREEEENPKPQTEETGLWKIAEKRIMDSILSGEYKPGTRIQTPDALAAELGMGKSSVYRAYSALREDGWLSAKHHGNNRGTRTYGHEAHGRNTAKRITRLPEMHDLPDNKQRRRLAAEMRLVRKVKRIGGREMGRRIGISQSKLSRIEQGTTLPSASEVTAWATAAGAPEATDGLYSDRNRSRRGRRRAPTGYGHVPGMHGSQ